MNKQIKLELENKGYDVKEKNGIDIICIENLSQEQALEISTHIHSVLDITEDVDVSYEDDNLYFHHI